MFRLPSLGGAFLLIVLIAEGLILYKILGPKQSASTRPNLDSTPARASVIKTEGRFAPSVQIGQVASSLSGTRRDAICLHYQQAYSRLFGTLKISADVREEVVNLLVDQEEVRQKLKDLDQANLGAAVMNPDGRFSMGVLADIDNDLQLLLGQDGFRALCSFRATMDIRNDLANLRRQLAYTSEPLSDDQVEALVAIGADSRMQDARVPGMPALSAESKHRARSVLSEKQYAVFLKFARENEILIQSGRNRR